MAIVRKFVTEEFYSIETMVEWLNESKEDFLLSPTIIQEGAKYIVIVYKMVHYYD